MERAKLIAEHQDFYDWVMDQTDPEIEQLKQQAQRDWEVEQD